MHDVDEPSDVHDLVKRLLLRTRNDDTQTINQPDGQMCDILTRSSAGSCNAVTMDSAQPFPRHTWKALVDMNFVQVNNAA